MSIKFTKLCRQSTRLKKVCNLHHTNNAVGKTIDLRSDTVTKPSQTMLRAMINANVGDDVYKEDPCINKLEEKCALLFGMERALFVPSGTMGNLICLLAHCGGRGESVIIGSNQHVCCREQGNYMQFGSIITCSVPNMYDGTIALSDITKNIRDESDFHCSTTKLICLENTHMRCGGIPLSLEYMHQVGQLARKNNIALHVDGARIFNAAVALQCQVSELLDDADSVSMCLSKGLGCPIGSVIGGSESFIQRALRIRKSLGGGMRQGGYLAAAGLHALEIAHSVIENDHRIAQKLAHGIKNFECPHLIDIDLDMIRTNLLLVSTKHGLASIIVNGLRELGILCGVFDASTIRFATHMGVGNDDVEAVLASIQQVLEKLHT